MITKAAAIVAGLTVLVGASTAPAAEHPIVIGSPVSDAPTVMGIGSGTAHGCPVGYDPGPVFLEGADAPWPTIVDEARISLSWACVIGYATPHPLAAILALLRSPIQVISEPNTENSDVISEPEIQISRSG